MADADDNVAARWIGGDVGLKLFAAAPRGINSPAPTEVGSTGAGPWECWLPPAVPEGALTTDEALVMSAVCPDGPRSTAALGAPAAPSDPNVSIRWPPSSSSSSSERSSRSRRGGCCRDVVFAALPG